MLLWFFQFAAEFVILVPVKIAAVFESTFKGCTGTMEPYLDVVQGQAEYVCYFGIRETLKVLEDQGSSVFLRKTVDEAAYSRIHLFPDGNIFKGSHRRCVLTKMYR